MPACWTIFWLYFYLCLQTADDTRQFLKLYDPDLGQPLPERTYAEDCRIYTPGHPNGSFAVIMDKMDVFVPSHFFGCGSRYIFPSPPLCLFFLPLSFPSLPPSPSPSPTSPSSPISLPSPLSHLSFHIGGGTLGPKAGDSLLLHLFLQALILRDVFLLNILSIAFELMEYTLECQLPNFGECWWDHVSGTHLL